MRTDYNHFTFVFEVADHAAFETICKQLHNTVDIDGGGPYRLTSTSTDDEIYRAQLYQEAAQRYSTADEIQHATEAIFQSTNLSKWSWKTYESETTD